MIRDSADRVGGSISVFVRGSGEGAMIGQGGCGRAQQVLEMRAEMGLAAVQELETAGVIQRQMWRRTQIGLRLAPQCAASGVRNQHGRAKGGAAAR